MDWSELLRGRGEAQESLHQHARQLRDAVFGNAVFVRGVVEISNICRENCHYCAMRRDNRELKRYRLTKELLLDLILNHRPASITDIDIQAGEDPVAVREIAIPLVRELRRQTDLGITLCLGTLSREEYTALYDAGGEYYILKIETGDAAHYETIEAPGTLAQRVATIRQLAASGWKVSSGFIAGLPGQTTQHLLSTFDLLAKLPLAGCSVSPFIAGPQTPLARATDGCLETTLNCVALLRRVNPQWIVPAVSAMRLVGNDGYVRALNAGANLTTINLTPADHRPNYPIYKRDRLIMNEELVLSAIEQAGCRPSPVGISEYLRNGAVAATG